MNQKGLIYVILAIGVIAVLSSFSSVSGALNLAALDPNQYGQDNIQRLMNLYNSMLRATDPNTGQPLNTQQQLNMLSQALQETGLFTGNPNYNNIDNLNNYTGIKGNPRYSAAPGSKYAQYPSVDAYVNDWMLVLSRNAQPLEASSITDYNNRLMANHYYEDSGATYLANLQHYYNLLSQTLVS